MSSLIKINSYNESFDNDFLDKSVINENEEIFTNIDKYLDQTYIDQEGKIVSGSVINIDKENKTICIDCGLKSECIIDFSEFFDENNPVTLNVGDKIELLLISVDSRKERTLLSFERAKKENMWNNIVEATENNSTITGIAFSKVKGGIAVDFNGIIGFLPGSQIDVRPVQDVSDIIASFKEYKVLSLDKKNKGVIVSRKDVIFSERESEKSTFLESIKEGDILDGVVKNNTNYGSFVDLGTIDGLLHITDISWSKINHPSEILEIGQKVKVKVIKYDKESRRLSLGMKQLLENPWNFVTEKYKIDSIFEGVVSEIENFGIVVKFPDNVSGFIHNSDLTWNSNKINNVKSAIEVGDKIKVMIKKVNIEKLKISLSKKHTEENPWKMFSTKYKTGEKLNVVVKNVVDFGIFVDIENEPDLDGLIHSSDITWTENPSTEMKKFNKGDKIEAMYLSCDLEQGRISFGLKQLVENALKTDNELIKKGNTVTCEVVSIEPSLIHVKILNTDISASIQKMHLSKDREDQRTDRFATGDKVDAKIIVLDQDKSKIVLSIKEYEEDQYKKIIKEYGSADTGATIGKIINKALLDDNESNS